MEKTSAAHGGGEWRHCRTVPLIRTVPSVPDLHRIGRIAAIRGLRKRCLLQSVRHRRWGIAPRPKTIFYELYSFYTSRFRLSRGRRRLSFLLPPYISRPESRIFFFLSSFLSKKAGEKQDSRLCFDRLFTLYAVSYGQRSEYRAKGGRINESK